MRTFHRKLVDRVFTADVGITASITAVVQMGAQPMVRGYVLAGRRLQDAVTRSHVNDIYIALFEISNWLDSLSERDQGLNGRGEVQAVKFARNRTHHQWASAVQDAEGSWSWRPLENLPVAADPKHRNAKLEPLYQQHLERRPVVEVFDRLEAAVIALAPDAGLG